MLSIKIKDIHQWEDIDHINAIVRTSPRATHVVRAGSGVFKGRRARHLPRAPPFWGPPL